MSNQIQEEVNYLEKTPKPKYNLNGKGQKAIRWWGPKNLALEEIPIPEIEKSGDEKSVIVEVKACGICGTDFGFIDVEDFTITDTILGNVLGHEAVGIIKEIGSEVKYFKVGDRVCIDPNLNCQQCENCKNNYNNMCENMQTLSIGDIDGGLEQFVKVQERQLYHLLPNISWTDAACIQPLSCCLNAWDRLNFKIGKNVAIIGGGTMGLIFTQLAKYQGAVNILVVEPVEAKRKKALDLGATVVLDPYDPNYQKEITALKQQGIRWHQVIEASGKPDGVTEAVALTVKGGSLCQFGTAPLTSYPVDVNNDIIMKELTITSSYLINGKMQRAIELVNAGIIQIDNIVENIWLIEDSVDKIIDYELRNTGKVVILPNGKV